MSLIVRSVCNNIVYEDFLGFIDCHKENYNCENTEIGPILSGKVLASTVINVLNKHHLDLKKCVGIGTDGCSVMLGEQKGAVAELKKLLVNALKSPYRVTAMNMICQVLELLESKRKNVEKSFDAIYAQVNSLHEKLDINVSIPRICARQINRANIQTNNPKDYFRITVYIPILDFVIEDLKFRFDGDLMNILNLNVVLPSTFSKLNTDEIGMSIKKIAKFLVCLGYDDYDEVLTEMKLKSEIDFSVRLLQ
nr:unnamed protein product [Callosobruchus analis]